MLKHKFKFVKTPTFANDLALSIPKLQCVDKTDVFRGAIRSPFKNNAVHIIFYTACMFPDQVDGDFCSGFLEF